MKETQPEKQENAEASEQPEALEQNLEKVSHDLQQLKSEAGEIKKDLNSANDMKETAYSKKEEVSKTIVQMINSVKELRNRRDSLTNEVKALKEQRQKLNGDLGEKIARIKKLYEERDKLGLKPQPVAAAHRGPPPAILKKEIERLEYKIETEVMSFDKEQKLMKLIKEKKKQLGEVKGGNEILDQINSLSREIKDAKKKANDVHKQIQAKASESQRLHEELIGISKKIDESKQVEEAAYNEFMEAKKKYVEVSNKLKEKSSSISESSAKMSEIHEEQEKVQRKKVQKKLEDKKLAVDEKLKKGMKLTTDDLLSFQKKNLSEEEFLKELEKE